MTKEPPAEPSGVLMTMQEAKLSFCLGRVGPRTVVQRAQESVNGIVWWEGS